MEEDYVYMAVQLSKSNNMDGRGEKKESQGQTNCGQILLMPSWQKNWEICVQKSNEPMISNGTKLIKGK